MGGVRVLGFSNPSYVRLLGFLYPSYSILPDGCLSVSSGFIVRYDVVDRSVRERLDYMYSDCVFVSSRIFDEMMDESALIREVLGFRRRVFGSRVRSFRPLVSEGDGFVDCCIRFMFTGEGGDDDEDSGLLSLWDSYGSRSFMSGFIRACGYRGSSVLCRSMDTFVLKVCRGGSDSVYYRRASMRLGGLLRGCMVGCVDGCRGLSLFYRRHYGDLCGLWRYMLLCRSKYFR